MTSQTGHHGGGSQLYPNQGFVKIKGARENVLSHLRALLQILNSICFCWKLLFLSTMTFMLTHAHGKEQTGVCKVMDPAIFWDIWSSVVNFETIGLCPCSPAEQLPVQLMNICIPRGHLNMENLSPEPWWPLSLSRANVKVVVTVLAIIGGIGLAGRMLYKRHRAFTEADIIGGLMSGPAVARRSDSTFEIHLCID